MEHGALLDFAIQIIVVLGWGFAGRIIGDKAVLSSMAGVFLVITIIMLHRIWKQATA